MNYLNKIIESVVFGIIMTLFGFLVSYLTDFLLNRPIIWVPSHSYEMASGTFTTSALVFLLFSEKYIKFKLKN